jgi:RNA polymerase sigma-70 factor (ECF subfamily)
LEKRQAFDLLFYQGLSQEESAAVLGVSVRTLKRRWREARLDLAEAMRERMPRL